MTRSACHVRCGIACLAIHVLSSSANLSRYSLGLGLGISGNSADAFLQLTANIFGGPAETVLVHY
jgi:hypothetical protein